MKTVEFKEHTIVKGTPSECAVMLKALKDAKYEVNDNFLSEKVNHIWFSACGCWYPHHDLNSKCNHELTQSKLYEMIGVNTFNPSKPFEVSDDGENWDDWHEELKNFIYDTYIGFCPNTKAHFVSSSTGEGFDYFNFIRNIQPKQIKREDIESVTTKEGTFTNFEIVD